MNLVRKIFQNLKSINLKKMSKTIIRVEPYVWTIPFEKFSIFPVTSVIPIQVPPPALCEV